MKEKTRMTIHRALAELKTITARITKAIEQINPVGLVQKDKLVDGKHVKEEFEKNATSDYQSAIDLINRKNQIKSAIVEANAKTVVKIGEREMSIADAITEKSAIDSKKALVSSLKAKYQAVSGRMNLANEKADANAFELAKVSVGAEKAKDYKNNADVMALVKPYLEANTVEMVDPLKVLDVIKKLEEEISTFEMEVDAVLSEINAITFIEF